MSKNMLINVIKHTKLVMNHKWIVFKLSCKLGIPFRGFMHDFSKFSFAEFWESAKYYDGEVSPILISRRTQGFSNAWLHHGGRNKHHTQYWVDFECPEVAPVIPYKYMAEMICDKMSACITYNGKNWTPGSELEYWKKERLRTIVNPKIDKFLTEVFTQVRDYGIDKTFTKQNIKGLYKKYCIDDKTKYKYEFQGVWKILEK